MIKELTAITLEYMKHRIEKETEQILELSDELEEQERHIKEADFEIERLNNIIKEVREYTKNETWFSRKDLLEILDKEKDNE